MSQVLETQPKNVEEDSDQDPIVEAMNTWELGRAVGILVDDKEGIMTALEAKNGERLERKKKHTIKKSHGKKKNQWGKGGKSMKKGEYPIP